MSEGPRTTQVGSAGGTAINIDLKALDLTPARVTLSAAYSPSYPPGYPTPPYLTGASQAVLVANTGTVSNGSQITLMAREAAALVAAGKAAFS